MKVYLCKLCYCDGSKVWRTIEKVFNDEAKALLWKEQSVDNPDEWREYEELEVE